MYKKDLEEITRQLNSAETYRKKINTMPEKEWQMQNTLESIRWCLDSLIRAVDDMFDVLEEVTEEVSGM